ncbi:YeeE/YedE family protein [Marinomonas balearica]|uniref:Uncharacterized protein n=1 Tax=Marinomonas balearica TaxID=491947 RepID=A0A4R6M722_9GAMM|nr:YeeE/YedE family protein [Marinomonas balearica]TDO96926.1 hypothetical protein DFP79_2697 [Marinomonas balearica]
MSDFTYPIIGGLLIGLSASILLLGSGRVAGISGLLANLLFKDRKILPFLFLAGLILGGTFSQTFFGFDTIENTLNTPFWMIILSGLLVGYGTRLGSGCTSGHGVCGIPRLSLRSLIATCIFIVSAIVTVILTR